MCTRSLVIIEHECIETQVGDASEWLRSYYYEDRVLTRSLYSTLRLHLLRYYAFELYIRSRILYPGTYLRDFDTPESR